MEVKFNIDIKTVRKSFAIIGLDIPSDEEILTKMQSGVVDLTKEQDEDSKQAELAFALMAIGQLFQEN
jgi:hypothetical protein